MTIQIIRSFGSKKKKKKKKKVALQEKEALTRRAVATAATMTDNDHEQPPAEEEEDVRDAIAKVDRQLLDISRRIAEARMEQEELQRQRDGNPLKSAFAQFAIPEWFPVQRVSDDEVAALKEKQRQEDMLLRRYQQIRDKELGLTDQQSPSSPSLPSSSSLSSSPSSRPVASL